MFERIVFDAARHTYTLDGQPLASVSSVVKRVVPEFDAATKAAEIAARDGREAAEILAEWEAKREAALARGNALHDYILMAETVRPDEETLPEMTAWRRWRENTGAHLVPHWMEWKIGDAQLGIGGTLDALMWNADRGAYELWDWKTGKGFWSNSRWPLLEPFSDLGNCELSRYSLQVSLYWLILERNTDLPVRSAHILYLSPDGFFYPYEALDLRERLRAWLGGAA